MAILCLTTARTYSSENVYINFDYVENMRRYIDHTAIVTNGGSVFEVKESPQEIIGRLSGEQD